MGKSFRSYPFRYVEASQTEPPNQSPCLIRASQQSFESRVSKAEFQKQSLFLVRVQSAELGRQSPCPVRVPSAKLREPATQLPSHSIRSSTVWEESPSNILAHIKNESVRSDINVLQCKEIQKRPPGCINLQIKMALNRIAKV